jgi:hypothetical protein
MAIFRNENRQRHATLPPAHTHTHTREIKLEKKKRKRKKVHYCEISCCRLVIYKSLRNDTLACVCLISRLLVKKETRCANAADADALRLGISIILRKEKKEKKIKRNKT